MQTISYTYQRKLPDCSIAYMPRAVVSLGNEMERNANRILKPTPMASTGETDLKRYFKPYSPNTTRATTYSVRCVIGVE